ncbi:hypothetical protein CNE_BB2p03130 (plasmid) [Cupriavidus necator N-1]|uniref:Uncharacterized protein n=1 Tax=Cupriavidus necator (strain ATCC 43291 / DSM 13513 / CCUG 52238 / LMG 8453 / N-1) TaxID=1042878 RepID=F8GZ17_CUPNN|nr:hypothetical protein [Cupriavidus necator]AEI83108.1 hypothetical protein CNE_BB2p03130 [Cupriavidus necator N-1]MDX6008518.1 hypothetical protein [Cupriavidus necator]
MTTLIKVTFTGTTGEETTGKAQYDHASGLVTLPTSFLTLIEQAKAVGIGYALVAHEDGYQFPLLHDGGATYRMDRSRRARRSLLVLAWKAVAEPTKEQRQQSGRFAHTLSAAAVIGAAGYLGTNHTWSIRAVTDVISLVGVGVVLFFAGAILSKGD